ncbi:serine/threonine protein kinase [Phanerochaete sordida]|uniref:Serine/threonine protein kinase n=1 Tax=Phanerochaete sordida TaxID=48140 RepID=A0A9P3G867_9APHY|nr:serine/threonine protein kinase [Phanerochaete sordida]
MVLNEDSDRLEDEAGLYCKQMQHLQGTTVPKFYGLFSGTYINMSRKTRAVRCIITEEWGTSMATVKHIPMELRITIAEAALRIHAAGVQHNDLRLTNILISSDNSEVRITDFDNAGEHDCGRAMPVILYSWEPTLADFGCQEIHDFMCYFGLWTPDDVFYLHRWHSIHLSSTAEEMLENAKPDVPGEPEEQLLAKADAVLKQYTKRYGARFPFIGPPGSPIEEGTDAASFARLEPKVIGLDRLEKCRKPVKTHELAA